MGKGKWELEGVEGREGAEWKTVDVAERVDSI